MSNTKDFYDPEVYDARAQGVPGDVEFFLGRLRPVTTAEDPFRSDVFSLTRRYGR